MNTKNKLNNKIIKTIITMMLVVVFLIGEIFSPFVTFANASNQIQYDVDVTVVDYYDGTPIEGAVVTFNKRGSYAPIIKTSDINGKLGNISLHNGKTDIYATKDGYDVCIPSTVVPTPKMPRSLTVRLIKKKIDQTKPSKPVISIVPDTSFVKDKVIATIDYLGSTKKQYRIDLENSLGEWKYYNGSFDVTENCTIEAMGTNASGISSDISSYTVNNIDKTAPDMPTIVMDDSTKKITITPGIDSGGSDVKEVRYQIWNQNILYQDWTSYAEPFNVNLLSFTVKAKTIDNVGNESQVAEQTFNLSMQEVTMEVSDTTGIIDKYDTATQNPQSNRYDKADNQYKLLGDSYINIATQGNDTNFAQYQFIKSDTKPTVLPNDNWNEIDLTKEEINDDVDMNKVGNLTQRSYDVSHLGTISDETKWNNRGEVFKTPFEATTYKAASYSNTKEEYGGWQSYVKADGSTGQRWVTKSTFMNQMNIGLNDAQNKDYKEASKFWGYIKVPTTGSYNFAATSDDGCSADITVNGTTVRIVDMFKVQGSTFGSTGKTLQLEANRYYPIYIEYFNWGGEAEFRLQYKESSASNWQNIPQSCFYPSKSTAPGEYATNRFTGRAGIKIPDEVGKYYIAYRTGKKDANNSITEIQKSGIYGAFIRDERFMLSRSLNNNGADNIGDEFEINYTITPNDIPVTDIYKNYQAGITNIADTLTSSNLKIQQVLPNGLTYVGASDNVNIVNNSNEISGVINSNVVYNLVGSTYKATPITITIKVKPTIEGTFNLLKDNSILTYTDVSIDATKQGAQRQSYFPDFSLNVNGEYSVILKNGIYDSSSTDYINENNFNVVNTMPTALAMLIDVKSSNPVINWSIDDITKISNAKIQFNQYEISNGSINQNTKIGPLEFNAGNIAISNSNGFNMEKGKKYIIVYTITPKDSATGSITIGANIEGSSSKPLTLNIKALPDLF